MRRLLLFGATVFLSAFLLFQVQPVIGKAILPWFGSGPGVWNTCLVFFQCALLGGYAYAHFLVSRFRPKHQAIIHGVLLVVALVVLPITPAESLKPTGAEAPAGRVLLVLLASVGLPYFVLSSTGPLLQGWFTRLRPGRAVYWLYALSNVGSLLALLTYPFWVEPSWTLHAQAVNWSLGFGAFVLLCVGCAWAVGRGRISPAPRAETREDAPRPGWGDTTLWFLLSACASALLLATTNQLCLDVAVMPFLWVVPLAIYLLSFIVTFTHDALYVRPLVLAALPLLLLRAYQLLQGGVHIGIAHQVVGYGAMLLVACLALHGELARSKPSPRHLTFFFLIVSLGGACGGLLVALGAPAVFDDFHELPLLLCVTYALAVLGALQNTTRQKASRHVWLDSVRSAWVLGALAVGVAVALEFQKPETWFGNDVDEEDIARVTEWFKAVRGYIWLPIVLPFLASEGKRWLARDGFWKWWSSWRRHVVVACGILASITLLGLLGATGWTLRGSEKRYVARGRNFYGVLAVKEYYSGSDKQDWTLTHGRIMHGFQYKQHRDWPTSYYPPEGGIGLAIQSHPKRWTQGRPFRIGVVGLGTGTIAAYANARVDGEALEEKDYVKAVRREPGDVVRYYEINSMVHEWAERYFTYLADARKRGADVKVCMGDARLVLERQLAQGDPQRFDVLAIDAFSSDAIPIHLLTKESCDLYFKHISPDGVLAIHVTNRFIDLIPVVRRIAKELGKEVVYVENNDDRWGIDGADWLLLTTNTKLLDELWPFATNMPDRNEPDPLWTDDYSSVYPLVKNIEEERDKGFWAVLDEVLYAEFMND